MQINKKEYNMLHDKDIREPLFEYLEETHGKIRIIEEKNMGESRADVVMICPESITGIEIKSDADTYTRLEGQIKDYDKFFDYNILVVGSTHAASAAEHIPEYWGLISVEIIDEKIDIYKIRDPQLNPKCDIKNKIRLLWRPELAHIQEICKLPVYKAKSKDFVREAIVQKVPRPLLDTLISDELFERDYNIIAESIKQYRQEQHPEKRVRKKSFRHKRKRK